MSLTENTAPSTAFLESPLDVSRSLAAGLLQVKAVEIQPSDPFTWSSGWKSPIYCDNRMVLGYPLLRELVISGFSSILEEFYPGVEVIAGTATAGIPHASILADRLGIATAYVRGSAKGHGKQKRVEGRARPGDIAVVIEDTLSTGNSAFSAVDALREEGVQVAAVCSIFSYDFPAAYAMAEERHVPTHRLLNYTQLIKYAKESGYVSSNDVSTLLAWREAPEHYSPPGQDA